MRITRLLLILEVCNVKPTYGKSWVWNLLMWSDLTLDPSFKVKWGEPNLKVLITHLFLDLEVSNGKSIHKKSWAGNFLMWSDLTLDPSFKVKWREHQTRIAKHKSAYNSLIIGPRDLQCKPTYKKSWVVNLLMWSDLTLGHFFKVKRGQPNLRVLITHLFLVLEACSVKPTYRKSLAGNLLMWSDLTLSPSFEVK